MEGGEFKKQHYRAKRGVFHQKQYKKAKINNRVYVIHRAQSLVGNIGIFFMLPYFFTLLCKGIFSFVNISYTLYLIISRHFYLQIFTLFTLFVVRWARIFPAKNSTT